jgi:hypothetical protein
VARQEFELNTSRIRVMRIKAIWSHSVGYLNGDVSIAYFIKGLMRWLSSSTGMNRENGTRVWTISRYYSRNRLDRLRKTSETSTKIYCAPVEIRTRDLPTIKYECFDFHIFNVFAHMYSFYTKCCGVVVSTTSYLGGPEFESRSSVQFSKPEFLKVFP